MWKPFHCHPPFQEKIKIWQIHVDKHICCHWYHTNKEGCWLLYVPLMGIIFFLFFYSLDLFKVEPKPRYVNRTHGMPAGSVAFLPSFVQHHDTVHLNPPSMLMPFVHTQPWHVPSHRKSCLLPPPFTTSLLGISAGTHGFNKINKNRFQTHRF